MNIINFLQTSIMISVASTNNLNFQPQQYSITNQPQQKLKPLLGPGKVIRPSNRTVDPRLVVIEKQACQKVEEEYRKDVINQLKMVEDQTLPDVNMIDVQPELEWYMRPYLLDFLIDSHLSLRLQPETLFLAVNLIDRYCSMRVVFKKHFQLVGCTALWIAAKYEDKKTRTPTISELKSMCCNAYEEDMFIQMETHVLNTLCWSIGHSTVEAFLAVSLGTDSNTPVGHVARYLCEISMFHRYFITVKPSIVATSAHILALHILNHYPTIPSSASPSELQCISLLNQHMGSPSKCLNKKYS